ncbi:hypothetical protein MHW98_05275 [Winkia sp. ACRQY]|mgnify:CR=1 FL=1|uniref:type ISP restriction/modification enzyme n=1 Tax=unclassified Winkia TaxID=2692119 RepID=UPI000C716ECE|nr:MULTISPECIES: type ISP restriction/modification enzyme [unclassified Winkia]MCG7302736.1 hypothetical protein [Winkia sp. ACRQY]MDK8225186.1 hypothetical protein [Winkia sp. UMB750B]MDK8256640.1 hypothetical protein [Winkia sp. UMB750A]
MGFSLKKELINNAIIFNDYLNITGIPEKADEWKIGGRSPLEWVLDRYRVTTHKASGIVNDPNDFCREINNPSYIVDLIQSLVTVSLTTQDLLAELPALKVIENN